MRGSTITLEEVEKEVIGHIQKCLGIKVYSSTPIHRGWMNFKWVLETGQGKLFVKQYHPDRFNLNDLEGIKTALQIHAYLHKKGIPTPKLHMHGSEYLLWSSLGHPFVVMDYVEGERIKSGTFNEYQAYELGIHTAQLHNELKNIPRLTSTWMPSYDFLMKNWSKNWELANKQRRSERTIRALRRQKEISEKLDWNLFKKSPIGWAHFDLWADNLLYLNDDSLSAILDFDRVRVIYPELDIARAILSISYTQNQCRPEIAGSFIEGYNLHRTLTFADVERAFKLLFVREAPRWFEYSIEEWNIESVRFFEEILFIADHFEYLDEIIETFRR